MCDIPKIANDITPVDGGLSSMASLHIPVDGISSSSSSSSSSSACIYQIIIFRSYKHSLAFDSAWIPTLARFHQPARQLVFLCHLVSDSSSALHCRVRRRDAWHLFWRHGRYFLLGLLGVRGEMVSGAFWASGFSFSFHGICSFDQILFFFRRNLLLFASRSWAFFVKIWGCS
jgi:hypothetical protein